MSKGARLCDAVKLAADLAELDQLRDEELTPAAVSAFIANLSKSETLPQEHRFLQCANTSPLFQVLFSHLRPTEVEQLVPDIAAAFRGPGRSYRVRGHWLVRLENLLPDINRVAYFAELGYFFTQARALPALPVQGDLISERDRLLLGASRFKESGDRLQFKGDEQPCSPRLLPEAVNPFAPARGEALAEILREHGWSKSLWALKTSHDQSVKWAAVNPVVISVALELRAAVTLAAASQPKRNFETRHTFALPPVAIAKKRKH